MTSETKLRATDIIRDHISIEKGDELSITDKLDSLGLDSLDFLDMTVALEGTFGIRLAVEESAACQTVGDLIALVESKC